MSRERLRQYADAEAEVNRQVDARGGLMSLSSAEREQVMAYLRQLNDYRGIARDKAAAETSGGQYKTYEAMRQAAASGAWNIPETFQGFPSPRYIPPAGGPGEPARDETVPSPLPASLTDTSSVRAGQDKAMQALADIEQEFGLTGPLPETRGPGIIGAAKDIPPQMFEAGRAAIREAVMSVPDLAASAELVAATHHPIDRVTSKVREIEERYAPGLDLFTDPLPPDGPPSEIFSASGSEDEFALTRIADSMDLALNSAGPLATPRDMQGSFGAQLGAAAGKLPAQMIPAIAAQAIPVAGPALGMAAAGAVAGLQTYRDLYQEAIRHGKTPIEAEAIAKSGAAFEAVTGAGTAALPLGRIARASGAASTPAAGAIGLEPFLAGRFGAGAGARVAEQGVAGGFEEMAQDTLSNEYQNLLLERSAAGDERAREMLIAFILGAGVSGAPAAVSEAMPGGFDPETPSYGSQLTPALQTAPPVPPPPTPIPGATSPPAGAAATPQAAPPVPPATAQAPPVVAQPPVAPPPVAQPNLPPAAGPPAAGPPAAGPPAAGPPAAGPPAAGPPSPPAGPVAPQAPGGGEVVPVPAQPPAQTPAQPSAPTMPPPAAAPPAATTPPSGVPTAPVAPTAPAASEPADPDATLDLKPGEPTDAEVQPQGHGPVGGPAPTPGPPRPADQDPPTTRSPEPAPQDGQTQPPAADGGLTQQAPPRAPAPAPTPPSPRPPVAQTPPAPTTQPPARSPPPTPATPPAPPPPTLGGQPEAPKSKRRPRVLTQEDLIDKGTGELMKPGTKQRLDLINDVKERGRAEGTEAAPNTPVELVPGGVRDLVPETMGLEDLEGAAEVLRTLLRQMEEEALGYETRDQAPEGGARSSSAPTGPGKFTPEQLAKIQAASMALARIEAELARRKAAASGSPAQPGNVSPPPTAPRGPTDGPAAVDQPLPGPPPAVPPEESGGAPEGRTPGGAPPVDGGGVRGQGGEPRGGVAPAEPGPAGPASQGETGLAGEREPSGGGDRAPRPPRAPGAGTGGGDVTGPGSAPGVDQKPPAEFKPEPDQVIDAPDKPKPPTQVGSHGANYVITNEDQLGAGGAVTKFEQNIAAIKILKDLEASQRPATPEEQKILVKYTGWGGLKTVFDEYSAKSKELRDELRALVTRAEYDSMASSTLNAHYTSQPVVEAIWEAVKRLGFTGGEVLEPSAGIGHFIGLAPADVRGTSRFAAVEKDSITGGILKLLYPRITAQVKPFEKVHFPQGRFDLVISNVPFLEVAPHDSKLNKLKAYLHDYFFLKALHVVKPGGIVAFITTKGTMDKMDPSVRKALAEEAEFIGAIRLPEDAFKKNAGAAVVTDVIFLRKKGGTDPKPVEQPNWTESKPSDLSYTDSSGEVTRPAWSVYFQEHPEMVLGTPHMKKGGRYGSTPEFSVASKEGAVIKDELAKALARLPEGVFAAKRGGIDERPQVILTGSAALREGSFFLGPNGQILVQQADGTAVPAARTTQDGASKPLGKSDEARIRAYIPLRDATLVVYKAMFDEVPDATILVKAQKAMEVAYDSFVRQFGPVSLTNITVINKSNGQVVIQRRTPNFTAIKGDPERYRVLALEHYDEATKTATKADIFTRNVIKSAMLAEVAASPQDAVLISLAKFGRVDVAYLAKLMSTDEATARAAALESGFVYKDVESIDSGVLVTADDFLSGSVRQKLRNARLFAETDHGGGWETEVAALEQVQPDDLPPSKVDTKMGATWIPLETYSQFIDELLSGGAPPPRRGGMSTAHYNPAAGKWRLETVHDRVLDNVNHSEFGTHRAPATRLIKDLLNQTHTTVYDRHQDGTQEVNTLETEQARAKQDIIAERFDRWVWADEDRAKALLRLYNDRFNDDVARSFDGSHLHLPGVATIVGGKPWTWRQHQKDVIWRFLQGKLRLLDHAVGAGKTSVMIAIAMEAKRLGLANKPMVAVPNHMLEQWAREGRQLYPGAKILIAEKADFAATKRKKFQAMVSTGDWDLVIIRHATFDKIAMSAEAQAAYMQRQIDELTEAMHAAALEGGKKDPSVREIQVKIDRLKTKLDRLLKAEAKDDAVTFEELGVDLLMVDEAHLYKGLFFPTRQGRTKGVPNSSSESQRAASLQMKVDYINGFNPDHGTIFATGTPILNSLAEIYIWMRYLIPARIKELGFPNFDEWMAMFGRVQTKLEPNNLGTGFALSTRFRGILNGQVLGQLYKSFADVKTKADLRLPVPPIAGGKPEVITVEPTAAQQAYAFTLASRMKAVQGVRPMKGADNILKVMNDGRKAAGDMRLVDPSLPAPHEGQGKAFAVAEKMFEIWKETEADRLTQLAFCDFGTPKTEADKLIEKEEREDEADETADDGDVTEDDDADIWSQVGYSLYEDIRQRLIKAGVPAGEIAFAHDAKTDEAKARLFARVRSGEVRILIGSTAKLGVGTNIQDRLTVLHEIDAPWRPGDVEQRVGRIERQGNGSYEKYGRPIRIIRYVTGNSFDTQIWGKLTIKQTGIDNFRAGDWDALNEIEDPGNVTLTYAEAMAAAAGDVRMLRQAELELDIQKLRRAKARHEDEQITWRQKLAAVPRRIAAAEANLKTAQDALESAPELKGDKFAMEVGGVEMKVRAEATKALRAVILQYIGPKLDYLKTAIHGVPIGEVAGGFELRLHEAGLNKDGKPVVAVSMHKDGQTHEISSGLGETGVGLADFAMAVQNFFTQKLPAEIRAHQEEIDKLARELRVAEENVGREWNGGLDLAAKIDEKRRIDGQLAEAGRQAQSGQPAQPLPPAPEPDDVDPLVADDDVRGASRGGDTPEPAAPRRSRGGATTVGKPWSWATTKPETQAGAKLIERLKQDTKGETTGPQAIVEMLVDAAQSLFVLGKLGTRPRYPSHYLPAFHAIRSRNGDMSDMTHEWGHALSEMVRDNHKQEWEVMLKSLVSITKLPESRASAKSGEEGFAEFVRRYIMDPTTLPTDKVALVMSVLEQKMPEMAQVMNDAHRAWAAFYAKDPAVRWRARNSHRPAKPSFYKRVQKGWWRARYIFGNEDQALVAQEERIYSLLAKHSKKAAQEWLGQKRDNTSAQFRWMFYEIQRVPQETSLAIYGHDTADAEKGLRVRSLGAGFGEFTDAQLEALTDAGFTIPTEEVGHGEWVYLTDYTLKDVADRIGEKDWPDFEEYRRAKAQLSRYDKFTARGKDYTMPGITDGETPDVRRDRVKRFESEHPTWLAEFKAFENFHHQTLLLGVLSGEFSMEFTDADGNEIAPRVVRIREAYEDYSPLLNAMEGFSNTPGAAGPAGSLEPSIGVGRVQGGSPGKVKALFEATEAQVSRGLFAYYENATRLGILRATQLAASTPGLSLELRGAIKSVMLPLKLGRELVTTLRPSEQAKVIADYLDQQEAARLGMSVAELVLSGNGHDPDTIEIQGSGEQIWRSVKPTGITVVTVYHPGRSRPAYYQVTDDLLYEFYARGNETTPEWLQNIERMMTGINAPVKRLVTHTVAFAAFNISRDTGQAMVTGSTNRSLAQGYYFARGLVNKVLNRHPEAIQATELLSRALDVSSRKGYRRWSQRFYDTWTEGVYIPGFFDQPGWAWDAPGVLVAAMAKPFEFSLWFTMQKRFAQETEMASRAGVFIDARARGLNSQGAQFESDRVPGNFGARPGGPVVRSLLRNGLFLRPVGQILIHNIELLTHVDRDKRKWYWFKLGVIAVIGAAATALQYLLADDEERKDMRDRPRDERLRTRKIGPFRVPYGGGPGGAMNSFGSNAVIEAIIATKGQKADAEALCWGTIKNALDVPLASDMLGTPFKTYQELRANFSIFRNAPIVQPWMLMAYANSPEKQTYPDMPVGYETVGGLIGASPIKVQYALRSIFMGEMDNAMKAIDILRDKREVDEKADLPTVGRLFAREPRGWNSQAVKDIQAVAKQYDAMTAKLNELYDSPEWASDPKIQEQVGVLAESLAELESLKQAMIDVGDLWDAAQAEADKPDPDWAEVKKHEQAMVALAREAIEAHYAPEAAAARSKTAAGK